MEITFTDKKWEKFTADYSKCCKKWGNTMATVLIKRLNTIRYANTLEDVRNLPGTFHELTGNRKGQWACHLKQPYRLIFKPHENPIPTNKNGQYIWQKITGIEVIEIVDYH